MLCPEEVAVLDSWADNQTIKFLSEYNEHECWPNMFIFMNIEINADRQFDVLDLSGLLLVLLTMAKIWFCVFWLDRKHQIHHHCQEMQRLWKNLLLIVLLLLFMELRFVLNLNQWSIQWNLLNKIIQFNVHS